MLVQVLWDVQTGSAICGSPTHTNFTMCVKFFQNRNDKLMTAGNYNLHVWEYDRPNNKLRPTEAQLGQLQRIFKAIAIDSRDQYAYVGTTTGDVLQVGAGWNASMEQFGCPVHAPVAQLVGMRGHQHARKSMDLLRLRAGYKP